MSWSDAPPKYNAGIWKIRPKDPWATKSLPNIPISTPGSPLWNREPVYPVEKKSELDKMREVGQQYLIESLEKQVKDLKKENRDLKKRIKELESVPSKPAPDRLILI